MGPNEIVSRGGKMEKGGTFAFANNAPWTIIEI